LMHRLQYRNFGTHESMVANHAVAAGDFNHAGIRWYELRKYNNNWSVFQQGTYAPDALHRWNGSIAMDGEGNIALGHSVSGENHYPSIGITGRKDGDSAGLMTYMEELAIAGTGSQTGLSRWGDYSSLNIDPADDATFWYTNEYFANMSYMNWKTRIATFTINSFQVGEVNPYPSGPENQVLSAYPNPFSTFVTFKWDMKGIGAVSIEISDINGRKLANMPFSRLSPGVHVFTADFSGMQEGVYICRFTCDGSVEIRRLIKAD